MEGDKGEAEEGVNCQDPAPVDPGYLKWGPAFGEEDLFI